MSTVPDELNVNEQMRLFTPPASNVERFAIALTGAGGLLQPDEVGVRLREVTPDRLLHLDVFANVKGFKKDGGQWTWLLQVIDATVDVDE